MIRPRCGSAAVVTALLLFSLTACGGNDVTSHGDGSSASPSPSDSLASAAGGDVAFRAGWVAAVQPMEMSGAGHSGGAAPMTAGYGVIANTGDRADRLRSVSSPAADDIQLHQTVDSGDSAGTMKRIRRVTIPAGGSVTLEPGGYHLMIMGLDHGLKPGSTLPLRLRFASGARLSVAFPVIDRAVRPGVGAS